MPKSNIKDKTNANGRHILIKPLERPTGLLFYVDVVYNGCKNDK